MIAIPRITFNRSGYYFIALAVVALVGFWRSYFSKLFGGDVTNYMHFHAVLMTVWITALISQPILIKNKKAAIHRAIGKATYVVLPLMFLSVILLAHSRMRGIPTENVGAILFIPFKDLIIIGIFYSIAIANKNKMAIHARAMIATGIACIEPALSRMLGNVVLRDFSEQVVVFTTYGIIYAIVITLIVRERKQTLGRWVFPLLLVLLVTVHALALNGMPVPIWHSFARWFISLPLTGVS
ncbi:MAG TPA: hypothetical protein P5280_08170 [Cyclobacteriaceae bacterium]|nr:hypothetical protein [Cyclobacteriaceae bacterium]